MPELPEVETVRRDLIPLVTGRVVTSFRIMPGAARILCGVSEQWFRGELLGSRIFSVRRRGKYLLLVLDRERTLVVHLRMTGSILHRRKDEPLEKFTRVRVLLDDGCELRFIDVRKFGTFQIVTNLLDVIGKLGPEPLSHDFTPTSLWESLKGRRAPLKAVLLNQEVVAGLGNIYADEALFLAGLHPQVPAGSLRLNEQTKLHAAIQQVIREGIEHRGVSFRDYRGVDGSVGSQQHYVRVFRRTDRSCDICDSIIRRTVVSGRSSHWCPKCQSLRQAKRKILTKRR